MLNAWVTIISLKLKKKYTAKVASKTLSYVMKAHAKCMSHHHIVEIEEKVYYQGCVQNTILRDEGTC